MGQSDRITLLTPNWWRSEKSKFLKLNKRKNDNLLLKGEKLDCNICMELEKLDGHLWPELLTHWNKTVKLLFHQFLTRKVCQ